MPPTSNKAAACPQRCSSAQRQLFYLIDLAQGETGADIAVGLAGAPIPSLHVKAGSRLTVEPLHDVGDSVPVEALVERARYVADVRGSQQVRQAAERVVARQRLLIEDIDGRARDFAASEGLNKIGLDHDRPARRIHKSGRRLHKR